MIRNKELTKEEAEKIVAEDQKKEDMTKYTLVMEYLNLGEGDLDAIGKIPIGVYAQHVSKANKLFAFVREKVLN